MVCLSLWDRGEFKTLELKAQPHNEVRLGCLGINGGSDFETYFSFAPLTLSWHTGKIKNLTLPLFDKSFKIWPQRLSCCFHFLGLNKSSTDIWSLFSLSQHCLPPMMESCSEHLSSRRSRVKLSTKSDKTELFTVRIPQFTETCRPPAFNIQY